MEQRLGFVCCLSLLLLCGCTVSIEGQDQKNEVTSFQIPSSKSSHNIHPASPPSSTPPDPDLQHNKHNSDLLLPVLELCHPKGRHLTGFEGLTPQGLVLDKVYMLVVSATSPTHHLPLPSFPSSPTPCLSFHQHCRSSSSPKVRSYPQVVQDYRQLRKSKSGLNIFDPLPSSEGCGHQGVAPAALSRMVELGEYLGDRYGQVWPGLKQAGKDPVVAGCVPEMDYFHSTSALLHGLLNEKQFMRMKVKKLDRDVVRGLDSHKGCSTIADIELFMEQAYTGEQEIFKSKSKVATVSTPVYRQLGVRNSASAKQVSRSLHHQVCEVGRDLCVGDRCLNLTRDGVRQLRQAISRHNAYLTSNPVFQAYAMADTYLHLNKVLSWLSAHDVGDGVMKVDVADDFFFLKVMSALGHELDDPVSPGTRLVLEQYRKSRSKSTARFWRVLVEGEVVTDRLKSCSGASAKGLCGVDTVRAYLHTAAQTNTFGVCTGRRDEL